MLRKSQGLTGDHETQDPIAEKEPKGTQADLRPAVRPGFVADADKAAQIFNIIAKSGANIDMIVQNVSAAATGLTDISFTLPKSDAQAVLTALTVERDEVGFQTLQHDDLNDG